MYCPNEWVIVKIAKNEEPLYKVFAVWYGGFANGDSWKLNSGISKVTKDERGYYLVHGYSGSTYQISAQNYRLGGYGSSVLSTYLNASNLITLLDQDQSIEYLEGMVDAADA